MSRICPQCKTEYDDTVRICIDCGIDMETGRALATSVNASETVAEPGPEAVPPRPEPSPLLLFAGSTMPGCFSPFVIVLSILSVVFGLVVAYFAFIVFAFGALFAAVCMGAVALVVYAQAVSWILVGRVQLIHDALMELDNRRWLIFFLVVFGPFVFIFLCAGLLANMLNT